MLYEVGGVYLCPQQKVSLNAASSATHRGTHSCLRCKQAPPTPVSPPPPPCFCPIPSQRVLAVVYTRSSALALGTTARAGTSFFTGFTGLTGTPSDLLAS
jgi:hypothetical protein